MAMASETTLNEMLLNSNTQFTSKMFKEVVKAKPGQSVVLSAFSVLPPLAQLALASVGESHDELLNVIEMPNDNVTKAVFSRAKPVLRSVTGVTLKMASKVYVAEYYELNSGFIALSQDVFGSEVANIDFSENENAANKINQWVENQTNNRIKDLVSPLSLGADTKAVLVNAIYFKGAWKIPFDKKSTTDRDFHVSKENVVQVPTMYNSDTFYYIDSEELDAQVLELKYAGEDSALYVILPHEVDGINKLEEKLRDPSLLDSVISTMSALEVKVYLPKFKIETTIDLKEVLENMNVRRLFNSDEARLENLLKTVSDLYINDAKQKAFIEVNEEGVEAAAGNVFSLIFVSKADERSVEDILHDGNNEFTAKMFTEVVKSNPGKSVVLSAFSVLPPLAQLALASVGESHDELLTAIGMPNDNVTKAAFSQSNERLKSVKGVTLKTASKIYVAKNYELNSDFADLTRNVFGSEVANVDFNENVQVANEVNQCVEDQTNHRIKDLVDSSSLDGSTRALLVNAIYFKGLWENPFTKELTREKDFHVTKDKVVKVPTMYNKATYKYIDSKELDAQVLELKYEGGDSALYVVLPHEVDGITKLEEKLKDPKLLDNVIADMYETEVEVYLPKFKIETTTDLKDVLEKMNVKRLFSPQEARLDNLLKSVGDLYISDARQKAFIEVNEEGAEAAAANVFGVVATSLVINEPPTPRFVADRPFTFVIRDKSLSLFNGVYGGN
ncbi:unnamed protein product [Danaus chrysippus]|uniref:(African queen) hypothetical protein n=2 Tax=Danaus TaxID=13036 RepID=A0A8J2VWC6_9NEOP|nr:unnamed protein product [Danaus chrysippus]